MKVTTKGQVTIPQEIREMAGILPNSDVEFSCKNGFVLLKKITGTTSRGTKIVDRIKAQTKLTMSTEQIMKLTRGQ